MSSRLVLFAARWGILFGLAGLVCAALVFLNRETATTAGERRLLLAAAALLSLAFVLAPFVRNAFASHRRANETHATAKTLLDELRAQGGDAQVTPSRRSPRAAGVATRLLVCLYALFGAVLAAVLWAL